MQVNTKFRSGRSVKSLKVRWHSVTTHVKLKCSDISRTGSQSSAHRICVAKLRSLEEQAKAPTGELGVKDMKGGIVTDVDFTNIIKGKRRTE